MNRCRPWIVLFVVALVLRIGFGVYWEYRTGSEPFYFGDSDTYWQLGKAIAQGKPYDYGGNAVHRMPGYPVLLAPLFLVFGENPPVFAARLVNILVGSLTVPAVGWLAWLLFKDRLLALASGWICAVDPLNIVMSGLILSEAPFCLMMVLQLAFWCKALRSENRIDGFSLLSAGLLAAAAVYCRPSWLYFVPFATVLGIACSPRNFRPILRSGLVVSVVLAIGLCPWWYRNYQITGHFVSTTLQTGPSLYDGLHPEATGASDMEFVEEFRNAEMRLGSDASKETLEYRLNRTMRQAAVNWARKHPDLVWKLARSKFVRLWNFWPNEATLSSLGVKAVVFCAYFPVLILGIVGALRSCKADFAVRLLWIPALYITALHVVFVSSIRYRAPAMICFAVLAAWVLVDLGRKLSGHGKARDTGAR